MVYVVATLANDADQVPALLKTLSDEIALPGQHPSGEHWAVGYYADRRALIIRKPGVLLEKRSVHELAGAVKSRIVLACVAPRPAPRTESPPYRHREWLFGYTGDLSALEKLRDRVSDKLPDFVKSELREPTGGRLAFGMFLAELHRQGLLDDPLADHEQFGLALRTTAQTISGLSEELGLEVAASYLATNGKAVFVACAGVPFYWKLQEGLEAALEGVPQDPKSADFKRLVEALKRFRAVVVAEQAPGEGRDWTAVEPQSTLIVDNDLQVRQIGT